MKMETVDDVLKSYLSEEGFDEEDAQKIIKRFHGSVETESDLVGYAGEAEDIEDKEIAHDKGKIRHGTSCFGIIKGNKLVFEM